MENDINFDGSFIGAQGTMDAKDTERRYHLNCLVKVLTVSRVNNGKVYESQRVYLIPQESTETIKFYDCYLPSYIVQESEDEPTIELVFMAIPLSKPFRAYVSTGDKDLPQKHIGLMSVDLLDNFRPYNEKIIRVDCLALSEHEDYDI